MVIIKDKKIKITKKDSKRILFDLTFLKAKVIKKEKEMNKGIKDILELTIKDKMIFFVYISYGKEMQQPVVLKESGEASLLNFYPYDQTIKIYNELEVIQLLRKRW